MATGVQRRPHSAASARQSASSSAASEGDTAVTACARSGPSVSVGDAGQEGRVGPAAERDQDPVELGQTVLENIQCGIHHELIVPAESPSSHPKTTGASETPPACFDAMGVNRRLAESGTTGDARAIGPIAM